MAKIELGSIGAVLDPSKDSVPEAAAELEKMGFSAIWLSGGPMEGLHQIADVVRATKTVPVGTAIISVDVFGAPAVAQLYTELEATDPGRFVVGLGGAHGPNPLDTLTAYLDALSVVPESRRVMAALGPKMFQFARSNSAGVLPVLITPEYTAAVRAGLGDETALIVEQIVVLDEDPQSARATARGPLGFLGTLPAYQASFRRMGFSPDEITRLGDRLVDALTPWGSAETLANQIRTQQQAGADHVALSVTTDSPQTVPLEQFQSIIEALKP